MNFEDTNQKFGWINEESGEKMDKKNKKFVELNLAFKQCKFTVNFIDI